MSQVTVDFYILPRVTKAATTDADVKPVLRILKVACNIHCVYIKDDQKVPLGLKLHDF